MKRNNGHKLRIIYVYNYMFQHIGVVVLRWQLLLEVNGELHQLQPEPLVCQDGWALCIQSLDCRH